MNKIELDQQYYNVGYCSAHTRTLQKREYSVHCNFLEPYLKKGINVLDCGCGPGTISIGIAKKIFPGQLVGIDIFENHLILAEKAAKKAKCTNNSCFQMGSVFDIPFFDNHFDVVFAHALLAHFKDPRPALQEMLRVLKPGGVLAVREPYHKGFILHPATEILQEAYSTRWSVANETGDYCIGIKLSNLFRSFNLKNIKHQFTCENIDVPSHCNNLAVEVMEYPYYKKLLAAKKISKERLKAYQKAWRDFAKNPDAHFVAIWGEAVGQKIKKAKLR